MRVPVSRRDFVVGAAASAFPFAPAAWAVGSRRTSRPTGLRCDLLERSMVVDPTDVRLSWMIDGRGEQTAYQVQVHAVSGGLVLDTGRRAGGDSVSVRLPGEPLSEDAAFTWRVRTWTSDGASGWSEPALFATRPRAWGPEAVWAPRSAGGVIPNWALLRRRFDLRGRPAAAWLRAVATSPEGARQYVFRAWLNGSLVALGPVRSPLVDAEAIYVGVDVTDLVRAGGNALAALCYAGSGHAFACELVLVHADGGRETVVSDGTWRAKDGGGWRPPSGFTGGGFYEAPLECIDAAAEPVGWLSPEYDDASWLRPEAARLPDRLVPMATEPMTCARVGPGRALHRPGGTTIDFGREVVGGLSISFDGVAGARVDVRMGEELEADGTARWRLRCGQTYRETWTLREGPQRLEHWGYRAFRYVTISLPQGVRLREVEALRIGLPWREESSFASSDADLDAVRGMCAYSIAATRLDIYQDTPTRERGPYEGDAIINQLSEYATQRSFALARYSIGYLVHRRTWPTEYGLMPPILAWRDYLATGDDRLMRERYGSMVEAQLFGAINADGVVEKDPGKASEIDGDLVDWPIANRDGFVFTRVNTVVNAWQYASLAALADIALALDRRADAVRFRSVAGRLRRAIAERTLDADGVWRDGLGTGHRSQHATAFAIALGLADDDQARRGAAVLAEQGMRMSVYGAQFLLEALYRGGQPDAARALMTGTGTFSWLHMMRGLGATITMEAWDPSIKPNTTFSHAWGTAPVNVIARKIAGVESVAPGAARLLIRPDPGSLRRFDAVVPTLRGDVRVTYDAGSARLLAVETPANCEARIILDHRYLSGSLFVRNEYGGAVAAGSSLHDASTVVSAGGDRLEFYVH